MKTPSVVIVDMDWQTRERLRRVFEKRGYVTWTCPMPELAISIFATVLPDVVLIDLDEFSEEAQAIAANCRDVSPGTHIVFRNPRIPHAPQKAA